METKICFYRESCKEHGGCKGKVNAVTVKYEGALPENYGMNLCGAAIERLKKEKIPVTYDR